MRTLLNVVSVGLLIAGCSPKANVEGEAEALVKAQMKDPASAQFQNLVVHRRNGAGGGEALSVCGEVNGKNAFGGYTGFVPFRVDLKAGSAEIARDDDIAQRSSIVSACLNETMADADAAVAAATKN